MYKTSSTCMHLTREEKIKRKTCKTLVTMLSIEAALCLALTNLIVLGRAQSIVQSSASRAVSHFLLELPTGLHDYTMFEEGLSVSTREYINHLWPTLWIYANKTA